ncbi:anti-anti-sigma factor [Formivibrio citricus]|uniref:Anti-anti-sigma factor n=1 Tax=Formivibrio citricus TaxID=83765 RepID=A0A1I4V707_9NEIS|nr:STAS domain-containing protein [Formivibrio citricus]SFM96780.1 anti-anti-sigma factor [Formivibrio citricus]
MEIQIEERESERVLALRGEVNIYHAAQLRDALLAELNAQSEIGLDLEHVSEMDTSAIQIVVALLRTAADQGKLARVVKVGSAAANIIRFCNLQDELGLQLP